MDTHLSPAICAVIQVPATDRGGRLQRCYEEVYRPAIADAGLIADTLCIDGEASADFVERIAAADVCFADITEDHPALWMILGSAVALGKPLCIVAAQNTEQASAPVPLPLSTKTISYPLCLLPSDYVALQRSITDHLCSIAHSALPRVVPHSDLSATLHRSGSGSSPEDAVSTLAPVAGLEGTPVPQTTENDPSLSAYEIIALALIAKDAAPGGMGVGKLAQSMHKFGLVRATSLAVNSLRRKHCVVRHPIPLDQHGITSDIAGLSITPTGLGWLNTHANSIQHAFSSNAPVDEPTDLIDFLSALRFRA